MKTSNSKFEKRLAPSLLSANFAKLGEEIQTLEKVGIDWFHVDVMDGHFVPNLTMGPIIVEWLRKGTKSELDCHLMVSRPGDWIDAFAKAGASGITIHAEASAHLHKDLSQIRKHGVRVGVSINPATPLSALEEVLDEVDLVLLMSVNPGFGGQKFIDSVLRKVETLARLRGNRKFLIEIDGGIHAGNIRAVADAGCDVIVAGSAVFADPNPAATAEKLQREIRQ